MIEGDSAETLTRWVVINRKLSDAALSELYAIWRASADYVVSGVDLTIATLGQSNLAGRGSTATSGEAPAVGTYIYDKAEEFRLAYEPSGSIINQPVATVPSEPSLTTPNYSFVTAAGKALKIHSGKTTLWVPCAVGSTSIAVWNTPATRDDRTTLFGALKYRFRKALSAKGGTPVIILDGFEGSALLPAANFIAGGVGTAYQAAMTSLINNVRTYISDCPIIMRQLAADDTLADAQLYAAVGEAQRQLELSTDRLYLVVSHDLARNASPDDIHVSRAGQEGLAPRMALAIREHVLGEAVNGTGPRIVGAIRSGAVVTLELDKAINASGGNYGNLFRVYDGGVEATVSSAVRNADTTLIDITCSASLSGPVTLTYGYRAGPANAARTDMVTDGDGLPLPTFGPIAVPIA